MEIEVESVSACNKKIKFKIPHSLYQTRVKAYYKNLGRNVKVPGFRAGKVPVSILEQRYGPEVKKEVLTQLVSDQVTKAIQEKGLRAVSAPNLLELQAEEGTDIEVTASVEVLPEVEVKDISGIEIPIKIPIVTEKDLDRTLEGIREQKAQKVQVTDRPALKDDYLKVDFKGTLDGETFEGGEAKDYIIQVGSKQLVEDLEDGLIGMTIGEDRDVKVNIPDTYFNKTIAGKEVDFHIVLRGIQVKELPELNDEFARTCDPTKKYENLEDMRQKVRQELEDYERKQARKTALKILADAITEKNPIDVPEGLAQEQIKFMIGQERRKQDPSKPHDHDQDHEIQVSEADRKKFREPAIKILQQELLLDKLATDWSQDVSDEEMDQEIEQFVSLLGGKGNAAQLKKEWAGNGTLARLHSRMRREKTLNAALDKVVTKEEKVDRKEIITDN